MILVKMFFVIIIIIIIIIIHEYLYRIKSFSFIYKYLQIVFASYQLLSTHVLSLKNIITFNSHVNEEITGCAIHRTFSCV